MRIARMHSACSNESVVTLGNNVSDWQWLYYAWLADLPMLNTIAWTV